MPNRSQLLLSRRGVALLMALICWHHAGAADIETTVAEVLPKIVKIYGAGGIRGLEAYQSGALISADGHILTAYSYVLDTQDGLVQVILNDGREFEASLTNYDPATELAILKIEAGELPHFRLDAAVTLAPGDAIRAFGNLYGIATGNEPVSVLHGVVAARTKMSGRRGAFDMPFQGDVYVIDAITNNAGAAGGIVTDRQGRWAGIIGKEIRNKDTGIWLNYAVPIPELQATLRDLLSGKRRSTPTDEPDMAKDPWSPLALGVLLIPDLLPQTPPFVEHIIPDSPAAAAGLQPDDLLVFVEGTLVRSARDVIRELHRHERQDAIDIAVKRGSQLIPVTISAN